MFTKDQSFIIILLSLLGHFQNGNMYVFMCSVPKAALTQFSDNPQKIA